VATLPTYPVRFPGPREFLAEWERSLAKGGVFVDSRTPVGPGATVRIVLELPGGGGTVPILGQVSFAIPPDGKRPGMGVRFRLEPPVEEALRAFAQKLSRGPNAGRVLVVDDDALIVAKLEDLLKANGFHVRTAASAVKALGVVKTEPFHAILSDLTMPRMDGFEFRDHLLQDARTAAIPFILITASNDPETRETAKRLGATAFIAKPITNEPLFSVLRNAIAAYGAGASAAPVSAPEKRSTSDGRPSDRSLFAKPGEFRLDEDEPGELLLGDSEPELPTLDGAALEALEEEDPGPVVLEIDIAALESIAPPPPSGDTAMSLVCSTCGSPYSIGDDVEDERLLTSCPDCISAGNALS
jgi:CheY-like chemotaxis protein